jgi:hypothetical protein
LPFGSADDRVRNATREKSRSRLNGCRFDVDFPLLAGLDGGLSGEFGRLSLMLRTQKKSTDNPAARCGR